MNKTKPVPQINNKITNTKSKSVKNPEQIEQQYKEIPEIQQLYIDRCNCYELPIDSTILVVLNCKIPHLSLTADFDMANLLPLRDVLFYDKTITSISFRKCSLGSAVCYPLRDILMVNTTIKRINLDNNGIDHHGAIALSEALKINNTLEELDLRNNRLSLKGALILAEGLKENTGLKILDVAGNGATYEGIQAIELASRSRIRCDTSANAFKEELLNSITHGIGVLLSLIGGISLLIDAQIYSRGHRWGVGIYVTSLFLLYLSSTLCHSLTFMKRTGFVFQILDHASIYILIAGTYTPFCFVNLSSNSWTGTILASIIWFLAILGISLSFFTVNILFEIVLYITMGWLIIFTGTEVINSIPYSSLILLILGGLAYTCGVYFFVLGLRKPMNHVIWHIFVLTGSVFHFFAIREAIFHKSPESLLPEVGKEGIKWLGQAVQSALTEKLLAYQCEPCPN